MFSTHILYGVLAVGFFLCVLEAVPSDKGSPRSGGNRVLSRKRRFLLFPPGANFISGTLINHSMSLISSCNLLQVTISGGKGSLFETPRGYNLVAEMDMYHPLPDYMYHATSLRLGEIALYPNEQTTTAKPTPVPTIPLDHYGHELTQHELDVYLAKHPEAWVPLNWAKERIDWSGTKVNGMKYLTQSAQHTTPPVTYQSWKKKLWESTGNDRLYYSQQPLKRVRSLQEAREEAIEPSLWTEANHLNISHHLGWEHFHHYRDRRSLFDHLETTVPSFFGFHMRECLLRSICEARNLLPPKGRSMTADILRVIFTYPLKADLADEYSEMMRADKPNCRQLFSERCPLSILQLILFGKFEL
uniref:Uncharacterized protein n=1 Tax=Anopheles epiroticus TaxID=199890 RepID=A0A182P6P7_9DIPT